LSTLNNKDLYTISFLTRNIDGNDAVVLGSLHGQGGGGPKTGPMSASLKTPAMLMSSETPLRSPQVERLAGGVKHGARKGSTTSGVRKTPGKTHGERVPSRPPTIRVSRTTPGKHTPLADRYAKLYIYYFVKLG